MPQVNIGKGVIRPRDQAARTAGNGAWEIKIDVPRKRGEGKRKTIYATIHGSRFDAELRLAELRKTLDEESYVDRRKMTVRQWLEEWLGTRAVGQIGAKTFERQAEIVRRRLIPALGAHRLGQLEGHHIQAFYLAALRERRRRVRRDGTAVDLPPLSAQTVKHYHRTLAQALKHAQRLKLIDHNPALAADPPRPKRIEMKILDPAQTGTLIRAASGSSIHVPVLLAATTGLRRGEVLGLRWRDVDLEKGTLLVAQTLEQTKAEGLSFRPPKTERSRRLIPLMPFTIDPLRAHRAQQKQDRLRAGSMWEDNDLVCCQADGTPLNPRQVTKNFAALVQRLGFGVRLHDLRHTHLSQLLAAGVNVKVVSERAGHASAFVTLTTYAHTMPGMQQEAVDRLDAALRPHLQG